MIEISALTISWIGILVVFVILVLLEVVIKWIGILLQRFMPSPQPDTVNQDGHDQEKDQKQLQQDIAIITAIMKLKGHTGNLTIRTIK